MSDLQKTIDIIFRGVDELSGPMGGISGGLSGFKDTVESVARPLSDVADQIVKVDLALAALASGAIVLAVTEAGKFEAAMAEINTILGLSAEELSVYSNDVLVYSRNSTQSLESITEALYNAASLGISYSNSLDVLAASEKLAVATKTDLNSALQTLVGTMTAFGAPMSEMGNYSDAFFTIVKDGKTTLPELAQSIANVTGIAAAAGIDFDTLGASIAALTAAGAPTSLAITQLKAAIQALAAPTPAATKAAEDLGVAIGTAAIQSKGFPTVLRDVYEATGGSLEAMRLLVPSIEGAQGALILGADAAGIFAKAQEDMANKAGATDIAFKRMKDNLDLLWQNLLTNFKAMVIEFGQEIDGEKGLISAVAGLFAAIGQSVDSGAFKPILDKINALISEAESLFSTMGDNLPKALEGIDWSNLLNSLDSIQEAIESLFDGVDLSTPEGLKDVIQKVVNSLSTLGEITAGIIEGWKPFVAGIMGLIESFNEMDTAEQRSTGNILGLAQAVTKIGVEIAAAILLIGDNADKLAFVFEVTVRTISGAFDLAVMTWNALKVAFYETALDVLAVAEKLSSLPGFGFLEEDVKANTETITAWKIAAEANMLNAADSAAKNLTGIQTNFRDTSKSIDLANADTQNWLSELEKIPGDKQTLITLYGDPAGATEFADMLHEKIPEEFTTKAGVDSDEPSIDGHKDKVDDAAPEEKTTKGKLNPDSPSIQDTKQKIDDAVPASKMMEIQLQGDIDKELEEIKAKAATIQTAFEWKAKIDIAQIEADAKVAAAAFDSIGQSVEATAGAAADMFSSLLDNYDKLNWVEKRVFEQYMAAQMAMEQQALNMQQQLIDAQVAYMNAKADALRGGDGLIKISSDGLEPALEALLWHVMDKVQIRVTEEAGEFLLGL